MHWWYGGWWGGGMLMMLFWVVVVVGVAWLIWDRSQRNPRESSGQTNSSADSALDILQKRYAAGEISREEYQEMKEELKRN